MPHFCTEEQIESEFTLALKLIREVLGRYGFSDYRVRLSLRDENPESKFVQDDEKWTKAEAALRSSLEANGVEYFEGAGEAAFYGPKADFIAKDALGREWQISTIQVDFIQPPRLGCTYIDEEGKERTPSCFIVPSPEPPSGFSAFSSSSMRERSRSGLHPCRSRSSRLPTAMPITRRRSATNSRRRGYRAEVDARNEKMNKRIREQELQKVPVILVMGDRDVEAGTVSVRRHHEGDLGAKTIEEMLAYCAELMK